MLDVGSPLNAPIFIYQSYLQGDFLSRNRRQQTFNLQATMKDNVPNRAKQRIAILSPFFYPEPISTGKYNGILASGLASFGHGVEVICSHPIYPQWQPEISDAELTGVAIHRGGSKLRYPKSAILRRFLLELWFFMYCSRVLFSRRGQLDKIISIFPPSLFMLAISKITAKKLTTIGIVHDLQGVYAKRDGGLLGKALGKVIHLAEKSAFSSCNHLVFLSETMRRTAIEEYDIDEESTSVHYPFVNIQKSDESQSALNQQFSSELPALVYSGALGEKQNPAQLTELFIAVLDRFPHLSAKIFSQGPIFETLKKQYSHPRLEFWPLVSEADLPELLHRSYIQVIPQAEGSSEGSLPSKLPNIIAAHTKLLCITDPGSELSELVARYSLGAVSSTWQQVPCLNAIEKLISLQGSASNEDESLLQMFTLEALVNRITSVST